jgi:hypothetical protein
MEKFIASIFKILLNTKCFKDNKRMKPAGHKCMGEVINTKLQSGNLERKEKPIRPKYKWHENINK